MIVEYLRPSTISEALALLARQEPITFPMGGGTYLNRTQDAQFAVVDLQALGLGEIKRKGNLIHFGATVKLQDLVEYHGLPDDFYTAVKLEATYNLRQMATIAGTLVSATGRSALATVFLSLDASMEIVGWGKEAYNDKLGNWLPKRENRDAGSLITGISVPGNSKLAFESIARSPADQPIVCAGVTQWPSGRTRLALGGYGKAPIMAMDGTESDGIENAARSAYSQAEDEWASAEYRQEMAGILAKRCLERLEHS